MEDAETAAEAPVPGAESAPRRRPAVAWLSVSLAAAVVVVGILGAWVAGLSAPGDSAAPGAGPTAMTAPTPSAPSTTPAPTPDGFAANTAAYDVAALPQVNVFAVIPALPVDDDAFAAPLPEQAVARGSGAPVWADPTAEPVAYLPREYTHDGTVVPVVEKQEHWAKVLLTGRQAVPSQGNPTQVTGWVRLTDVDLAPSDTSVVVSISGRTIDIVRGGVAERVATDFAWGTNDTPTPLGRTFIMTTDVVPAYGYTRGHPIVYWAAQSPTLDGFGGTDVAITAFHYHDSRSGPISNGCIRVDEAAITKLAALPLGTPVIVNS